MNQPKIEVVNTLPKKSILDYWSKIMPGYQPRDSQMKTFEWIESLPHDIKYLLLEMPVGGGKSPVGLAISAWMSQGRGSSYILTPQKILQRQYEDSFTKQILVSMYGKSNYTCTGKSTSCETGSTIKPRCKSCPQKNALQAALGSNNLVLNYTLALLYFTYLSDLDPNPDSEGGRRFEPRKLMVMDECHNLEHQLVNFSTLSISSFHCEKMGNIAYRKPDDILQAHEWLRTDFLPAITQYTTKLSNEIKLIEAEAERSISGKISKDDEAVIKNFNTFSRLADTVTETILVDPDEFMSSYVYIPDDKKFTIKALYGKKAFHGLVKPMADKFLFMSSTILNKNGFCEDLGINPAEAAFLSLDSEFDRDNRTVTYNPQAKMNYGWDKPERKPDRVSMITEIKELLELYAESSGIIHTGSFKLAEWVIRELALNKTHNILHHNPNDNGKGKVNRDDVIAEYISSAKVRPTLLVSPSITEGLDLKDDLGRFTIFAKVPYPSIADAWIKRRMEISPEWYTRQALIEMIQGSGRTCRSDTDWGMTYILDGSFGFLYHKNRRKMIPEWWDDSVEV